VSKNTAHARGVRCQVLF